jgi:outer membrane lipopolysaccharide assembly protein LptE/RlpB
MRQDAVLQILRRLQAARPPAISQQPEQEAK